eukprot:CAMPEP_0185616102 /NCGR_PEP_ID=MMETSP0436-20130131/38282_1 /TAXON_ID=626734 ORGANISM="Favella taraikaensis, Strain Fe Narragansett Bay" /NCGR_SAMPLE_ID=MMETSP0436 /ASSEMBLY_ACC=CAM_ASM_000390 /LENGTH=129 /DNA_ID=CAMNT_0028252461 /DNA_START=154 /DNA_END=539 /DNA_ORIENTATION=+
MPIMETPIATVKKVDFGLSELQREPLLIRDALVIVNRPLVVIVQRFVRFSHVGEVGEAVRPFVGVELPRFRQVRQSDVIFVGVFGHSECLVEAVFDLWGALLVFFAFVLALAGFILRRLCLEPGIVERF